MGQPLVIGPVGRRKGLSREIEQANTHNDIAEYPGEPWRVKTPVPRGHGRAEDRVRSGLAAVLLG